MMKGIIKRLALQVFILVMVSGIAGCTAPNVEKVNADEVKAYSDAVIENMLAGINGKDYAKFSADFDQQMKNAVTETKFLEICNQLGECQSKGITGADKYQGYTRAYYKGSSSAMSRDVTFTVVLSAAGDKKVSGFFYK